MRRLLFLGLIAAAFAAPALINREWSPSDGPAAGLQGEAGYFGAPVNARAVPTVISPYSSPLLPGAPPIQFASSGGRPPMMQVPTRVQPPIYNAFASPGEYLNFELSPDQVRTRWPRVSVAEGEDGLTGLRVALVSGPRPADIHGSLTYYFDENHKCQRITFRGWTGEPSELVQWLVGKFGFSRTPTRAAGLYEKFSWGWPKGVLRLDYPTVMDQQSPTEQYMVLLEIVNPSSWLGLSNQNERILAAMDGQTP